LTVSLQLSGPLAVLLVLKQTLADGTLL